MKLKDISISVAAMVTLLLLAELTVATIFPKDKYIVRPSVLIEHFNLLLTPEMWYHIWGTFKRTIIGFIIASALGISIGVLLGRSRILSLIFQPIVNILRPIPSSILIPLLQVIPLFGLNEQTYYFTIIFGGIWPILISTADGVRYPHPTAIDAIRQLRLSRYNKLRFFTLPQAATSIFSGMKISLSICLILTVTAEIILGLETAGLGYYQEAMGRNGNYTLMYIITLVVALLGFVLNFAFAKIEVIHPWLKYKLSELHIGQENNR